MDKAIPFVDLVADMKSIRGEIDAAIAGVLDSGRFVLGPEVSAFERELAQLCENPCAIGVSSGTDALLLALMSLGVGPGDEVVTTPFTFFATAGVIARVGATPVFADIEDSGFLLDPQRAASQCSDATRAILPVNLYGQLARLPEVPVPIIEDSAQSIGAGGARGQIAAFSFFPTKNVGAIGDAGAVVTGDEQLADTMRRLRTHGANPKYFHAMIGGNFRMDALQAAVLRVKLKYVAQYNKARGERAERYRARLASAKLPAELQVPRDSPEHVYHQFTLRVPRRDSLRDFLKSRGIATEVYYPRCLHLQECFEHLGYKPGSLPNAERAAAEALSLPIHPALPLEIEDRVVTEIERFYATDGSV